MPPRDARPWVGAGDADRTHRANNLCAPRRFVDPFRLCLDRTTRQARATRHRNETTLGLRYRDHVDRAEYGAPYHQSRRAILSCRERRVRVFVVDGSAGGRRRSLASRPSLGDDGDPAPAPGFPSGTPPARSGRGKEMNGRFGREGTTVMAYGSSTESRISSESGIVRAQPSDDCDKARNRRAGDRCALRGSRLCGGPGNVVPGTGRSDERTHCRTRQRSRAIAEAA